MGSSLNLRNTKRIYMGKSCWITSLPIFILRYQMSYSNATDLKLGISTYFFLLFLFLVFTLGSKFKGWVGHVTLSCKRPLAQSLTSYPLAFFTFRHFSHIYNICSFSLYHLTWKFTKPFIISFTMLHLI